MRLNAEQQKIIQNTVLVIAGAEAQITLFGSRLDDEKRGGDVDLLILANPKPTILQRAKIKTQLERQLNLPVDVLADDKIKEISDRTPFIQMALMQGEKLA